jgi:hypothetical protein
VRAIRKCGTLVCKQYADSCESSLQTFEFVNNNGSKYISWNNFFTVLARYYEDFQEQQPEQSQNYRPGPKLPKAIKPEDVLALEAILDLMAAVLRESEEVRGKMQENSSWHAVEMFFGLLGCPVPPSLKAKLAHALAQFAKSPGLVNKVLRLFVARVHALTVYTRRSGRCWRPVKFCKQRRRTKVCARVASNSS